MKKLIPTLITAGALALTLAACGDSNEGVNEITAKTNCETLVKQELTDPDGSDFQNTYDVQAWEIDGGYRIHGEVAVANVLGGKVPHVYECKVTKEEGSESASVILEALEPRV